MSDQTDAPLAERYKATLEKYEAALEKIALPRDHPDAIKNSQSTTPDGFGGEETMTVLDRAEKMQALARETLERQGSK